MAIEKKSQNDFRFLPELFSKLPFFMIWFILYEFFKTKT